MCQCRFINYDKCISLVGDVDDGEVTHVWKQGVHEKSLYIPLNFFCEPKTALTVLENKTKNKPTKKKKGKVISMEKFCCISPSRNSNKE